MPCRTAYVFRFNGGRAAGPGSGGHGPPPAGWGSSLPPPPSAMPMLPGMVPVALSLSSRPHCSAQNQFGGGPGPGGPAAQGHYMGYAGPPFPQQQVQVRWLHHPQPPNWGGGGVGGGAHPPPGSGGWGRPPPQSGPGPAYFEPQRGPGPLFTPPPSWNGGGGGPMVAPARDRRPKPAPLLDPNHPCTC